jgi:hypothetical protein
MRQKNNQFRNTSIHLVKAAVSVPRRHLLCPVYGALVLDLPAGGGLGNGGE